MKSKKASDSNEIIDNYLRETIHRYLKSELSKKDFILVKSLFSNKTFKNLMITEEHIKTCLDMMEKENLIFLFKNKKYNYSEFQIFAANKFEKNI